MRALSFFFLLVSTSIKASFSLRKVVFLEALFMLASNGLFLTLWWIFFHQFREINGWSMREMLVLNAICLGGYGLMQIFFGGARFLPRLISLGRIDGVLLQPQNILLQLLGSQSLSKGWGNLLTMGLSLFLAGVNAGGDFLIVAIGAVTACFIFTSVWVISSSVLFWMPEVEGLTKKYSDSLAVFSAYPTHIYGGVWKVVLFTLIPAGLVSSIPISLLLQFSWSLFFLYIFATTLFVSFAVTLFYRGLKRYQSGNLLT